MRDRGGLADRVRLGLELRPKLKENVYLVAAKGDASASAEVPMLYWSFPKWRPASGQVIPGRSPTAVAHKKAFGDKRRESRFQGIGTGAVFTDHIGSRYTAMVADVVKDVDCQLWQHR